MLSERGAEGIKLDPASPLLRPFDPVVRAWIARRRWDRPMEPPKRALSELKSGQGRAKCLMCLDGNQRARLLHCSGAKLS